MRGWEEVWAQKLELGEEQAGSRTKRPGGGNNSLQVGLVGTGQS